jgi:hypothetical protein
VVSGGFCFLNLFQICQLKCTDLCGLCQGCSDAANCDIYVSRKIFGRQIVEVDNSLLDFVGVNLTEINDSNNADL